MAEYNKLSDVELAGLLKTGDKSAYTEIFDRYSALLYAHAYNKLRDADEAHDVVQELFLNLWIKRSNLETANNLAGYLFTGVRNQIYDLIRHKQVVTQYETSFEAFKSEGYYLTDHLIREKQFAELIEREIAALPPRMREVFELRRKENLSNKEIAARMKIAESTVADQMKKALKILRLRISVIIVFTSLFNL